MGSGPGTGWGLGLCGAGMGWRRGGGRGQGFGWRRFLGYGSYQPKITKKEKKEFLEGEVVALEEELKAIKVCLTELKEKNN